ncbi:zinc finger protein 883-like [Chrysoperla carnea]|uniref:zinc finger protein 883-like n=1 Tax=Chrysoperla carnea TaxID=189513 RepID=UPI001D07AB64|nr:zinc finger protein 883-like [Chrysoperla carnea]
MISIFDHTEVLNMLSTILNIEINDGLPNQVCTRCSSKLSESYSFKQQCQKSEEILKQVQNTLSDENETDDLKCDGDESDVESEEDEQLEHNLKYEEEPSNNQNVEKTTLDFQQQEAYFYPIESTSDAETQKETALERALQLGPDKCDPTTKTCKICNKVLYNVHSLVRHVETHNENRKFEIVCTICNKGFYEKKHIKNHMLRHKGEARFKCDECKKPFYELNALRGHVKKKHPNKINRYKCKECTEMFVLEQDLELHERSQHSKHQYSCSECNKPFIHKYLLRKHQWMHAKQRMFHCKHADCDKSFKSKQVLHLHYKRCHSNDKKREVCNICGKSVVYLKNHIYIHKNEKYKCEQCEQEFTNKYSLDKHTKRKHGNLDDTELNPYLCNICGKRSENLTMLKRHLTTHSDVKTHKCPICEKLFKSIELVNSHVRYTHNNVRNFKCTECSKSFHTTSGLKLHIRTHTGERPYECDVCGKAFQQRSTLKTHMKVHGLPVYKNKVDEQQQQEKSFKIKLEPLFMQ